ncbi:MAG TPA: hypothetical protein VG326_12500 [Tepidisphaeraceae bacterium]|nr:hypothetical protein [Tepidisphaeraceae bacterium]
MRVCATFPRIAFFALSLFLIPALGAEPRQVEPNAPAVEKITVPAKFMRFTDDGHAGGKFETAAVTFRNKDGVSVRLVGAIHVGERSYYQALNKSFECDDAVLYELVKPKDAGVPQPGQKSDNPISQFQHMLKDVLNLDFQLDDIDYGKPNFVHADMDAETFAKMQQERGETFEMLMLKQVMKAFTQGDNDDKSKPAEDPDAGKTVDTLIQILTRPDMERQIKLAVAKQLDTIETGAMGLDNPDGSVIVTERNKVAMKVLEKTIAAGQKKISIFYGAAHMPDMTTRLKEMGFSPVSVQWNTAWDLTIRPDQPSGAEKLLKELFHAFDDN